MNYLPSTIRVILASLILLFCIPSAKADIWGELGKSLFQGLNTAAQMTEKQMVQNVISTPNKHSKDMKNFLACVKRGHEEYQQGNASAAWGAFYNAKQVAEHTTDRILYLAYAKYGWKAEIEGYMLVCWNEAEAGSGSVGGVYDSGENYYNPETTSSSPSSSCRKCHGNKVCPNCSGKGTVFSTTYGVNQYITCPACSGTKVCSLCGGR